ncbi:MAG: hypothetical protein IK083_10810 [Abditibacteriota bacterium]|nr:hypothetical protein [Abditibacteriota bacterium]
MKNGLTHIELLVMIAIIGISAAILFPVLNKAMEKVRRTQCPGNVKQPGLAFVVYEGDRNRRLPCISGRPQP